jgi:hypothetical protein
MREGELKGEQQQQQQQRAYLSREVERFRAEIVFLQRRAAAWSGRKRISRCSLFSYFPIGPGK